MRPFDVLQRQLATAAAAHQPGSSTPHVLVVMPSFSMSGQLLEHYGARFGPLEHRFLLLALTAARMPGCEVVYLSSVDPGPAVIDYHVSLLPPALRHSFRERLHVVTLPDRSWRSVAVKLLEHPETIEHVRAIVAGRPAMLEVWNVTDDEVAAAEALGLPIHGTAPALRGSGFKSAGRRLLREAGVAVPPGCEDVRDLEGVLEAVRVVRAVRPGAGQVVVKLDDSGAGDGNVVVGLRTRHGRDLTGSRLARRVTSALSEPYLAELAAGGVVEQLVVGDEMTSPSAQIDIAPTGEVVVVSTHEQLLEGPNGQVYAGCTFPARAEYAAELARCAHAVGERLAALGALGRAGVDFVAVRHGDVWAVEAIEINLRKGGTTHPFAALSALVPGRYDPAAGTWTAVSDGLPRCYVSTDNIVDPRHLGLDPEQVIAQVRQAGLQFDPEDGTGVVLQMLSGLAVDGRMGVTAIARSASGAEELVDGLRTALRRVADRAAAGVPRETRGTPARARSRRAARV